MANPISGFGAQRLVSPPNVNLTEMDGARLGPDVRFQEMLLNALGQTTALDQSAQAAIEQSLAGGDVTQVEVFSAVKKADLALRMTLQIRNKLLEGFNEIKQMQM